jgi:hypothetical protein
MRPVLQCAVAVDGWVLERVVDMPMYDDSGKVKDTYEVHIPGGVYHVDLDIDMRELARDLVLHNPATDGTLLHGTIRFTIRREEGS